ncbi:MAG: alpha-mannosidase [Verrucomicrobia bacterium]|nr:alpha-mannosidase [Verrucomicrobiota bacterium]
MALDKEWRCRIDMWMKTLRKQFVIRLGTARLQGFTTMEQLPYEKALRGPFRAFPKGRKWGRKWEYGWFKTTIVAPGEAAGQRMIFNTGTQAESLAFVNGVASGGNSWAREEITLSRNTRPGQKFNVVFECYAGHGGTPCSIGPLVDDAVAIPEPPQTQREFGDAWYGVWDEDAFQLAVDVETLITLRDNDPDQNSLRLQKIDEALCDFATIVDFELPLEQRRKTYRAARARLAPLLKCRNGSTAPDMFAFGHAHLDVCWLWPLAETRRKTARTLSVQLQLMKEYPFYKFMHSQPHLYWMAKKDYPEIYARTRSAIKSGNIVAEGAMWVEPDMNITGGESLVRQLILGKRFLREEFGVESELLWLPDVFGYSAALPQILLKSGVKYFATAKIFWNYHGGQQFPHNTFMWEGIDGSRILSHLFNNYSGAGYPREAIARWRERVQKTRMSSMVYCFGHGDGGGGANREMIESIKRMKDLEGCPRVRFAGPVEFFKDVEKRGIPDILYVGELFYQCHRGVHTSQARTKRGNRKCEFAMRDAELWSAAAMALDGFKYPVKVMEENWRKILLNQFHDILPGSSIERVYEEANAAYAGVLESACGVAAKASSRLAKGKKGATVFNSLSWNRNVLVMLPEGMEGASDQAGRPLPAQKIGARTHVELDVPPCGWTSVLPCGSKAAVKSQLRAEPRLLENELIRVRFNEFGEITSIFDKTEGREFAAGLCNSLRMYKDIPSRFEAWDIDSNYTRMPVPLGEPARITVAARGPLVAQLKIARKVNNSRMTQLVSLRRNSKRVDFRTTIDWNECHKLLKVDFPVDIQTNEAIHEIQYGHLRRPNHKSWQLDADRFEVAAQKWTALAEEGRGFAVLNDCKYGVNTLGRCISLSLLRAPKAPDANADIGRHEFTYAFHLWNGSLADSRIVQEAYDLNIPASCIPGAAEARSLLDVTAPNVIIEAVKPAEDGSGDVIVRMYESMRTAINCVLSTSLPVKSARETDMLERKTISRLPVTRKGVDLGFRPFEIKTVRLSLTR